MRDPQAAAIELMRQLRTLADDSRHLRDLLAHWGESPIEVSRRAQARSHEVADSAARALDTAESLLQALRLARAFSDAYGDLGVSS